jgi:FkbM family methyltransferase
MVGADLTFEAGWEQGEREVMADYLGECVALIDVGANTGFYSILAARAGKVVVAVEPEQGNLALLRSNIALNDVPVEIHAAALSDSVGRSVVYGDGDMASLSREWQGVGEGFKQSVATTTLDEVIGDRWGGKRLFIKIDVEGFEDKVLSGAAQTLARNPKPYWLVETYPRLPTGGHCAAFTKVFETMHAAGYVACLASDRSHIVTTDDVTQWDRDPTKASNFLFV